jgi:hypothetical protein
LITELGSRNYVDGYAAGTSVFYTKYKGFQVQIFDSSAGSSVPLQLANAGGAKPRAWSST